MNEISVQQAFDHCEKITKSHYENFPVGSLLIPKAKRPYIWSIYAFARGADDFADEGYPSRWNFRTDVQWRESIAQGEGNRLKKLGEWETQLKACYEGEPSHPIFIALAKTVRDLQIPIKPLADLLYAFKMDVTKRQYANWKELLHYCQHSANPVGQLVLRVFGYEDPELFELSDAICTGLQLANFWQDIAVDREKDRIYVPLETLHRFKLSEESIFKPLPQADWKGLYKELGDHTLPYFKKGAPLPHRVKGRLSWELRCTWLGGMTILKWACLNPHRQLAERPVIRGRDKLSILWKSLFAYNRQVKSFVGSFA
jgi:phytoene synthase